MIAVLLVITMKVAVLADDSDATGGLVVFPDRLSLDSSRRSVRLVVSAAGLGVDLTGKVKFESTDPDIVQVDGHSAVPLANGSTAIQVSFNGLTTRVPVTVKLRDSDPVSLRSEVLPVLSRQGCSSGACHGSPKGKGGFRLSLRAFDPTIDETTLRNEFFGRRTNPLDPDTSLLLRKPLTEAPHAGGRRLVSGTTSHQVLRQWIAEGTRLDPSLSLIHI